MWSLAQLEKSVPLLSPAWVCMVLWVWSTLCLEECGCDVIIIFTPLIQKSLQQGVLIDKGGPDPTTLSFSGNCSSIWLYICVCSCILHYIWAKDWLPWHQQFGFCCTTGTMDCISYQAMTVIPLPATHLIAYCYIWGVHTWIIVSACVQLMPLCKFVHVVSRKLANVQIY